MSSEFLNSIKYLEAPVLFTAYSCGASSPFELHLSINSSTKWNWRGVLPLEATLLIKMGQFWGKVPGKKKVIKWCFDFPRKYIFKPSVIHKSKVKTKQTLRTMSCLVIILQKPCSLRMAAGTFPLASLLGQWQRTQQLHDPILPENASDFFSNDIPAGLLFPMKTLLIHSRPFANDRLALTSLIYRALLEGRAWKNYNALEIFPKQKYRQWVKSIINMQPSSLVKYISVFCMTWEKYQLLCLFYE